MGVFTGLLLLPLAPLRATVWIAERLADYAERELTDESSIRRLMVEAELAFEAGELSAAELEAVEDDLLERLAALGEEGA
jgi:gas vesicle protein GvpG